MRNNSIISFILRRWLIFLIAGIFGGLSGFLFAYLSKPQFESRLSFSLDAGTGSDGISGAMNLAAQLGLGVGGTGALFEGDNIIEIIKSRRMIEKVLLTSDNINGKNQTLAETYLDISGYREKLEKKPRTQGVHFPLGSTKESLNYVQDSVLFEIYERMVKKDIHPGRPDKKLSLYELKVTSSNEKFTKVFTDRLIEVAGEYYIEITTKKEKETVEVLEQSIDSITKKVSSGLSSRAVTKDANFNPVYAQAQVVPQLQQYNITSYSEAYKEIYKNLELARYQYIQKIPLVQIIDQADFPMNRIKKSKLKYALFFSIISVLILFIATYKNNSVPKVES
jgi:uncharacterized protein involved in exopolysaccharide biosynthesis